MCDTVINEVPQEMGTKVPFYDDTDKGITTAVPPGIFSRCMYAHNALLDFTSPFRGKKLLPSFSGARSTFRRSFFPANRALTRAAA